MESRINEIKNSNAMKKVASYKGQSFSSIELKEALLDVQNQLLYTTFEKSHAENLSYHDLYNYFSSVATEYELQENIHYIRFERNLKTIKKTIGALISGEVGEKKVAKALRLVKMDGAEILYNLELQATEIDRTEIDCLVINRSGIHMLEVKNYHGEIDITKTGEVIESGRENRTYSVSVKNGEKEFAVRKILKDSGISIFDEYKSILVLADNQTVCRDNYGHIPVCNLGSLVDYFRDEKEKVFTDEQVKEISSIIKFANCPKKYTWDLIDWDQLVEDYAYLMAYVEEASKNDYEEMVEDISFTESDCEEEKQDNQDYLNQKKEICKCILSAIGGAALTVAIFLLKSKS